MYSCMNVNEGMPPRLYRSPCEIHRDMARISARIRENEEMLSVHNLLMEMIPVWAEEAPDKWIPELEDTLAEATEALETLKELTETIEELRCELEDARCLYQL